MAEIVAEVERVERIIVTVDVEQFVAHYKSEWEDFQGDEEAFVKDFLNSEGGMLLDDFPSADVGDGVTVQGDYDETDITIMSVSK